MRAAHLKSGMMAGTFLAGMATTTTVVADPKACRALRFSNLGEDTIVLRTAAAAVLLETIGYEPEALPQPATESLASLASGDLDVFLGARRPEMSAQIEHYATLGGIEVIGLNADGDHTGAGPATEPAPPPAEARLAPSPPAADGGQSSPATSEAAAPPSPPPSPPPAGTYTLARAGFSDQCPNAATLFGNLSFPADMTAVMSDRMAETGEEPFDAAIVWFRTNREVLWGWLEGVSTFEGQAPRPVVSDEFGF